MRKAQKQKILEIISTMQEVHGEIMSYALKGEAAVAQDLLGQCQECAITVGTAIENIEGEGCITVSYVEKYCEALYLVHEALGKKPLFDQLQACLGVIETSVNNDIPTRKEIAFFPYKASMWDSLESVYLAARNDPACDAYCVPIPYFDLNPDKSFGELHYEGSEYPKDIEVIDWRTYNYEERRPDIIYIHNPYDNCNLVTSVHPRFYSANLKAATEELIYIPYFVLGEIEPDDQVAIEGMKHFCFLPGTINADKVIVQSEKMRQIYINEYLKAAETQGLTGKHTDRAELEKNFLVLGSPKFDKVQNTHKDDLDIPEEWLAIINKPDGTHKKIIFYNTTIVAFLENDDKMLQKIQDVLRIFEENKDEVALLWRPHPLLESTIKSMRPRLFPTYQTLVENYKTAGWGIYDDTADMDRAVVLSNAYYGDMSSVVEVYRKTGKPVMVQDVNVVNEQQ